MRGEIWAILVHQTPQGQNAPLDTGEHTDRHIMRLQRREQARGECIERGVPALIRSQRFERLE